MGAPPSLPNFDELTEMGLDYLAAEVASQTGLPPEFVDLATGEAQRFVAKAIEMMQQEHQGSAVSAAAGWLAPEFGLTPGALRLRLSGPAWDLPDEHVLFVLAKPLFVVLPARLPKQLPAVGETPLVLPMVVRPHIGDLPPYPLEDLVNQGLLPPLGMTLWYKNLWMQQLYGKIDCALIRGQHWDTTTGSFHDLFSVNLETKTPNSFFVENTSLCQPPVFGGLAE
jgi:hypothetical protein